eukprot:scaffold1983_cov165-Amphora_coffeaeformis.AAC.7
MQTSGSFRKINPTLQTLVTSLHTVMDTLQRAPPAWWKEGSDDTTQDLDDMECPTHMDQEQEEEEEDDVSIDLQQQRPRVEEDNDDDDNDDHESNALDTSMDSDD